VSGKVIAIIASAVVVLGGGGGAAYWFVQRSRPAPVAAAKKPAPAPAPTPKPTPAVEAKAPPPAAAPPAAGAAASAASAPARSAEEERLVRLYEGMKPKEAATVMTKLDPDLSTTILLGMRERQAGRILGLMPVDTAAELTRRISKAKKTP